ncbi:MAG: hypothetical protein CMF59_19415 [Leptospiraceae bacterium]|nr:hypothetical protein [Leptospiraceae bacterium]
MRKLWPGFLILLTTLNCTTPEQASQSRPSDQMLIRTVASSEDAFAFCANGQIRVEYRVSELRPHVRFGTWEIQDGVIRIRWLQEKGGAPSGSIVFCGSVCEYSDYEPFERTIDQAEQLSWDEIQSNQDGIWEIQPFAGDCKVMP